MASTPARTWSRVHLTQKIDAPKFPGGPPVRVSHAHHDLDFRNTTSFGMQLINTLVEQLKGKIELVNNRGTVVTITFPGHDRSQEEPT